METSQRTPNSQDDSSEVSPYPKENLERIRNRRANSAGSSQVSVSLTINDERTSYGRLKARKAFTAKTQIGVFNKKQEYLTDLDRKLEPGVRYGKLTDYLKLWLENLRPLCCNPNTPTNYAIALNRFVSTTWIQEWDSFSMFKVCAAS